MITEPTLLIERKGLDAIQQLNYLKILMATNSKHVVPVSRDERRYCVIDVANTHIGNREYFDTLNANIETRKVKSAFLYAMQNFDLGEEWDIRDYPDSVGLREQRYHSMNSLQHWLADSLNKGSFNTIGTYEFGTSWFGEITTAQLYKSYSEWFKSVRRSDYKCEPECVMSEYVGKIYKNRLKIVPGTNNRGFDFVSLEHAKQLFEEYEKINLSELPSFEPKESDDEVSISEPL